MPDPFDNVVFKGDVSPEAKEAIRQFSANAAASPRSFAFSIAKRTYPREVELFKREKDGKLHMRMVYELKVEDGALFSSLVLTVP